MSLQEYFETRDSINKEWIKTLEELELDYDIAHDELMKNDITIQTTSKLLDALNNNYLKMVNKTNALYKNKLNQIDNLYYSKWKSTIN